MKKLIALFTTLAVAATFCGAAAAYAEETDEEISAGTTAEDTATDDAWSGTTGDTDGGTVDGLYYPEFVSELDTDIACYAVSGSMFAMADDRTLYIYSGGTADGCDYSGGTLESYTSTFTISDLYYDGDGTLYLRDNGGDSASANTYVYSDGSATLYNGDSSNFFNDNQTITSSDGLVFRIIDRELRVTDMDTVKSLSDGTYSMLKEADGVIYVIKDGSLCVVEGSTMDGITVSPLTFEYADLSHGESIAIGNCAELLQTTADGASYVVVPAGQYVTRIDLSDLSGIYFKTVTENGAHTFALESDMTALVLCTSGNAMIVACGGEAYVTYNVSAKHGWTEAEAPFAGAQLIMAAGLYSSPYISEGTRITTLAEGATMSVLYELEAEIDGGQVLETNFCRVSYTDGDGNAVTGYVATGFLTEYVFVTPTEDDLTEEWNDDYSEDNVIVTVVLIIVIVVLIMAGVAYLAYFSGASRRNKKKPNQRDDGDGGDDRGDYGNGNGYGGNYGNGGYSNGNNYGNDGRGGGNSYGNNGYNGNSGYSNFNSGNGNNGYGGNGYGGNYGNGNGGYSNGNNYGNDGRGGGNYGNGNNGRGGYDDYGE